MSNSKRKHRGSDRYQAFLRQQNEQRELDFEAIAARYRKEIVQLHDGKEGVVFGEKPKDVIEPPRPVIKRPRNGDEDAELDYIFACQHEIVEGVREAKAGDDEAKQALRDRGVTFTREPKSIHSKVPQGRIGSVPRQKSPPKKPDGSGGKVKLWEGNTMGRLNPYIHRHYGTGDK